MQTGTQSGSILAELKQRTAHQHQQTEDGVDLMRDDFSLKEYQNLLIRFYAFYKPFEARMQSAIEEKAIAFDYTARLNMPRLQNDLQSLGMTKEEIAAIEPFDSLPTLESPEKIFGALYVVEGSTLGGQVIARHLKEKFGLDETSGIAFFSGYGKETGKMWNAFREKISGFAETTDNHEEIVKSANATFEKIGLCLAQK